MGIKLYADGANLDDIKKLTLNDKISGFTTNPTLMKKAGVENYVDFAAKAVKMVNDLPISLEVFSDDLDGMEAQAIKLSSLGANVYVKIPVTNTKGVSTVPIIKRLSQQGVKLNVTVLIVCANYCGLAQGKF